MAMTYAWRRTAALIKRYAIGTLLMCIGTWSSAAEPLQIAYFSGSARSKIGALIMVEVYKQANLEAAIVSLPGARNGPAAEASQVAGESVRVYSYVDAHPTLTRVEPPVTEWTTVAFYRRGQGVSLASPADLRKYSVGYVRGTRAAEDVVAQHHLIHVTQVRAPDLLFKMLGGARFEVAIDGGTNGDYWMQRYGMRDIAQFEINRIPLYHILSPKYQKLAPTLSRTIKRLTATGELAQIVSRAERSVLASGPD